MSMLRDIQNVIVAANGQAVWETVTIDFAEQLLAFCTGGSITPFATDLDANKDVYGISAATVALIAGISEPITTDTFVQQFSGEILLDPNEINAGTTQGWLDNRLQADLGNVGATNLARLAAGFVYPFPVKLVGFLAHHRNSATGSDPWGWVFFAMERNSNSNTVTTTFLRDESFDRGEGHFGLRDYANNVNQTTTLTASDFVDVVIPAGSIIFPAVGAPTADTTNNYVQIAGGYLIFERV